MNLKLIRQRAKAMQTQQPALLFIFSLPVILTILANFTLTSQDLFDTLPNFNLTDAILYLLSRQLFPSVIGFIVSIVLTGATYSYLDRINPKIDQPRRVLDIFRSDRFTPVFTTLLLKQLLLFLWNLVLYAGSLLSTYASARFLSIYENITNPASLTATSPEFQELMQQMPLMTNGILLGLVGLLLFLPQYYSLSLVELILYEKLRDSDYQNSLAVIRQSRTTMKGFKANRFVLDLSLLGWHFLNYLTRGVIGFYTTPYFVNCQIAFYDEIKRINQGPKLRTKSHSD